jgi:hypothetical protein
LPVRFQPHPRALGFALGAWASRSQSAALLGRHFRAGILPWRSSDAPSNGSLAPQGGPLGLPFGALPSAACPVWRTLGRAPRLGGAAYRVIGKRDAHGDVHAKAFTELKVASFKFAAIAAPFSVHCLGLAATNNLTIDTVCSHDSTIFTVPRKIDCITGAILQIWDRHKSTDSSNEIKTPIYAGSHVSPNVSRDKRVREKLDASAEPSE